VNEYRLSRLHLGDEEESLVGGEPVLGNGSALMGEVSSLLPLSRSIYPRSLYPRDSLRLPRDHSLGHSDELGVSAAECESKDLVADLELVACRLGYNSREFYSQDLSDAGRKGVFACDRGRRPARREASVSGSVSSELGEEVQRRGARGEC
jgi:hypothetical protein